MQRNRIGDHEFIGYMKLTLSSDKVSDTLGILYLQRCSKDVWNPKGDIFANR